MITSNTALLDKQAMAEATIVDKLPVQEFSETECSSTLSITSSFGADQHVKSVSFGEVEIREYKVILGDNPALTSGGPPVQLDWTPLSSCTLSVDDHQASRDETDERPRNGGKSSPAERISYLMEEYTTLEIQRAQTEARKIQQFRLHHKKEGFESVRILLEKAGRKCRKKQCDAVKPGSAEEWLQRYKLTGKELSPRHASNAAA